MDLYNGLIASLVKWAPQIILAHLSVEPMKLSIIY
ncbi:unnamed protein product [Schistosoma margrebowiei]|uniref:Uncharacterized protein n=1 Tax=Schistosoma margrebowiei TaxID=48269 RepID=A0A183M9M7_9TREM|nr:unnamed protein product [Schistosoma margrebowiei]